MKKSVFYLDVLILAGLLWTGSTPPKPAKYELREAYPSLAFDQPVEFVNPDGGTNRIFVIAQKGVIHTFPQKGATTSKVFLDLTNGLVSGGERGLLGLAFHPDFKQNGYFYVNYTRGKPLETVIARFQVSKTDPDRADPASQLILLTYAQPFDNHNGGKIAFGKDGYLYISAGDGGSGGDPLNNGQNLKALLGKIMRIDVNKKEGKLNYGIPKDNPFKGNKEGYRQEIYAYGLRNVWKFSFDAQNGQLWAGDVGQNEREEIDTIVSGGNYGWKMMEGKECFKSKECARENLKQPVIEYLHSTGDGQSVTGGFVYRGKQMPALVGSYVYGDYLSGKVWALKKQTGGQVSNELILDYDGLISSFGEDKDKELYICSYSDGKIMKLTGAGSQ